MTGQTWPNAGGTDGAPRSFWNGVMVTAVTLVLAVALLAGLFLAIWIMAHPLALLLAAIVIANAIAPVIRLWERVLPEPGAIAASYLLLIAVVGGCVWAVVPPLVAEAREAVTAAPALVSELKGRLDQVAPGAADRLTASAQSASSDLTGSLIEAPITIAGGLVETVLVIVMAVYWSLASDGLRNYALSVMPRHLRDEAFEVAAEVVETIGGYLRARIMVGAIVGVVVYIGLMLLGVEYAAVLALLAAFGELIPYLGPAAATVPALASTLPTSPWLALGVLIFFVVVQQVKSYLLVPTIVHHQSDIPPLLVIFSLVVGTSVGGVVGAVVAPPLAGALRIVVLRVATPPLRRWADSTRLGAGRMNQLKYDDSATPQPAQAEEQPPDSAPAAQADRVAANER
ncbi:MAG: AI-2E family transporter [Chloroflexota bacterium]